MEIDLGELEMEKVVVIGTGGLAREFSSFFSGLVEVVGFSSIDDKEYKKFHLPGKFFGGEISPDLVGTDNCVIAIGDPTTKDKVSQDLGLKGFQFPNLVHPSAVVAGDVLASESNGVVISPNCTIGSNVIFGNHVYVNFMVGVGHDCVFDGYTQINPGAQIGGFTQIGSHVLIGSNSTVRQELLIETNATVGAGSVVFGRVRAGVTVLGNPARTLKKPVSG